MRAALSSFPVRAVDMVRLLDTTLVCAIATLLIVRTQLWLTNYPQLGGKGLHIAHLLWGGLLMLVAIVVLLALVSPSARAVAAVVGGVGLGPRRRVGKFVTADNNYFFKPTAAIIYCFFIVFFLAIRGLDRRRAFTQREYLVNVIEILKEEPFTTSTNRGGSVRLRCWHGPTSRIHSSQNFAGCSRGWTPVQRLRRLRPGRHGGFEWHSPMCGIVRGSRVWS